MALTKKDIQMIKKIIDINIQRYMSGKPYVMDITYEELNREIIKIGNEIPDLPVIKIE